ncbi:HAD family phosphatase [uncultured Corynebacterium sp.]|uniref:HAD family hydrolase n=1 Tax=uncultured Corynebacterium sp. TaxID=159447 RepID=UPI0026388071|nr:HAD family hydrolase [uncultured Corynebacterium sp.]
MTASGAENRAVHGPDSHRVAAFFDLDKTIIATSSAFAFGRGFLDNGMITRGEALELFLTKTSYMFNGQSSSKMDATRDRLADMVAGWPVADVRRVVAETMNTVVTPAIYREARELIDWHREQGHDIVILSASASLLVEPIAKELGINRIVATEVEIEDGKLTGKITRYLKGEEKAKAMRELVEKRNYDLAASYAYSDSLTDVPMLALVGHPVAVNPERGLRKHALEHGWETRSFKNPEPLFDPPGAKEIGIGAGVVVTVTALTGFGIWLAQRGRGGTTS